MDSTPQASNSKPKWRKILLILFVFSAGFLTHALIFPDFLANGFTDVSKIVIPEISPTGAPVNDSQLTKIEFDGKKFSRNNVRIGFTRYLQITNTNPDKLMWLQSNKPELTTVRGYGEAETVKAQFNEKGTFIVRDKNNPSEQLMITVK